MFHIKYILNYVYYYKLYIFHIYNIQWIHVCIYTLYTHVYKYTQTFFPEITMDFLKERKFGICTYMKSFILAYTINKNIRINFS